MEMSESIIETVYPSISEATLASIGGKHALRILRGFVESGREKILESSLSQYYIPPVSMTEDGQFEELRSYARRSIRYIPDWISFDEFFDEFEPELKDCYEKAISEHKKQCENS
jgi:hypothetical protein